MSASQEKISFSKSFVHGELHLGFWSFAKKGAGALDSFFTLSSLSLYQFGLYQLFLSFYGILSDFFHDVFGGVMTNDIARYIGAGREDKAKRLFFEYALFRLAMAAVPWAVIFFGAPYVAARYGYGSEMVELARVLSFLFLADAAVALTTLSLNLRLQFKILAPRATAQKFLQFLTLGSFYFFSHIGIREIFISQIIGAVGVTLLLLPAVVKSYGSWRRTKMFPSPLAFRIIRSYGKWALPQSFLTDFIGKVRPWLIRIFLSTEVVGIFGVANTFISALKDLIPTRTPGMLIPRKTKDTAALERFYRFGTKYFVWFALLLCVAAAGAVPLVIILLFPKFLPTLPLFYLMLAAVPIFAFLKPMSFFLVAFRRQKFLFLQSVFQNALSLAMLLIFLPTIGILGLALTEVIAIASSAAVRYRYLMREGLIARFSLRALVTIEKEDRANFASLIQHLRSSLKFM